MQKGAVGLAVGAAVGLLNGLLAAGSTLLVPALVDVLHLEQRVAHWFQGAELGFEQDPWGGGFTFKHPDVGSC